MRNSIKQSSAIILLFTALVGLEMKCTGQISFTNIGYARHGNYAVGVTVVSNYAYVCYNESGLSIYNVSDPANPTRVSFVNDGGAAQAVTIDRGYAYLANAGGSLRIYNVTNPDVITNVSSVNAGTVYGVAVSEQKAYVACGRDGLRIFNVTNPAQPSQIGHFDNRTITPTFTPLAGGVAVMGHHAYVANGSDGLRIFDISDPSTPVTICNRKDSLNALWVVGTNNHVYVSGVNGIWVYDVSNPSNAVNVCNVPAVYSESIAINGHFLFSANDQSGLTIYDIWNPEKITDMGSFRTRDYPGGIATGVAASGAYAYVADYNDGFRIFEAIPTLSIQSADSSGVVLSWPAISPNYSVQSKLDIASTNWIFLTNNFISASNRNRVFLENDQPMEFFRLKSGYSN